MTSGPASLRYKLTRDQRLRGKARFDELFKTGKRRNAHPLAVYALKRQPPRENTASDVPLTPPPAPSTLLTRIGISIGRRCGNAATRNLIKRRLREAFRLLQHDLPTGMDYLIVPKPHAPLATTEYQSKLRQLMQ